MEEDEVTIREQNFHSQVREYIICFLLFAVLYIVSYCIITRYKRKTGKTVSLSYSKYYYTHTHTFISTENLLHFRSYLMLTVFQGIKARVLETFVMLFLLGLLILGIVWVASALIDNDAASMESLYDLWEFYLPYLYSCISLMGGLLLLMCTPVGLSRMFTVMGQLLVKPTILEDLDEQMYCIQLQEEALQHKLNGECHLYKELDNVRSQRHKLERKKKASAWEKNLLYPIVMLILLAGTAISVFLVALNILYLLVDETALPKGSAVRKSETVNEPRSTRTCKQTNPQSVIYLMVSSVVGFYSLRIFQGLTPRQDDTTMTSIIGCCVSILVLSSALPVMSRTLGITRFDLLGDFGRFNWLGNFYIVLSYNLLFAVVTTLCLVRKFTSAVREELLKALGKNVSPEQR
uniref:Limb development membrane protein 1 n=1 Tax=Astyanax mexicanus TaxID=7994 RepID=A0A8B9H300_ASTMX